MKIRTQIAAAVMVACVSAPVLAQQPATPPASGSQAQPTPLTPAEMDKQFAKMQEQMVKMNEQMARLNQTQDPKERQRLLQEHWNTMQSTMGMMNSMCGGYGMMGGNTPGVPTMCGMGGPTTGGGMMGGDYRNLTPEQLKQRQYMMDRWMPMQQTMMNHMMQYQNWMMQQPAPPAPPPK